MTGIAGIRIGGQVFDLKDIKSLDKNTSYGKGNKILDHLFNNEHWLNGYKGDETKANGTLDGTELLSFIKKIDKNGDGEVTMSEFNDWKQDNINVGSKVHQGFTYADLTQLLNGVAGKEAAQPVPAIYENEYKFGLFTAFADDGNLNRDGENITEQMKILQREYENIIAEFPNLQDNFESVKNFFIYIDPNVLAQKGDFLAENGYDLNFLSSYGGGYSSNTNSIAINGSFYSDYSKGTFAHEFGHSTDNGFSQSEEYYQALSADLIAIDMDNLSDIEGIRGTANHVIERNVTTGAKTTFSRENIWDSAVENYANMARYILIGTEEEKSELKRLFPSTYALVEQRLGTI